MKRGLCYPLLFLVIPASLSFMGAAHAQSIKAAYWPSYTAAYTPISSINTTLFTHLIYAFAGINAQTMRVEADDAALVAEFSPTVLSLTTLLAIGGGNANATLFAVAMGDAESRKAMINSSVELARANGFHGLNMDWEYPRSEQEMESFGEFLEEWRDAVEEEAKATSSTPLLLTAAVYYSSRVPSNAPQAALVAYPIHSMTANLDLVHIMAFDYHGSWENFTGEHTALSGLHTNFTTLFGLHQWIADGLLPQMAIVGLATYGKSWILADTNQTHIGAPAQGPAPAQAISKQAGIFLYFEVEDFISSQNATVVHDNLTSSAYCYASEVWIGYDDAETFSTKLSTFKNLSFKGYFFWALSYDVPKTWPLSTKASLAWDGHNDNSPNSDPPNNDRKDEHDSNVATHSSSTSLIVIASLSSILGLCLTIL